MVGVLVAGLVLIGEGNAVNEWEMAGRQSWPCHDPYTLFSLIFAERSSRMITRAI